MQAFTRQCQSADGESNAPSVDARRAMAHGAPAVSPIAVEPQKPALLLAPMEGVTDAPMRALMTERGGFSFCVTEFLRITHHVAPHHIFLRHVPELAHGAQTPAGTPVQIQLLGGDVESMAQSACVAVQAGAAAIDINFGCPAPTVNRHDGGASLLKCPERIRTMVAGVRAAVPAHIPVSAKLRLGWDNVNDIHVNAAMAMEGGAAWITIHGRTRTQGYKPPAYWEPIGDVRRRGGVPVVANGEIWTLEDFERCRDITGCEHFMIGRGALADPRLPWRIAHALGLRQGAPEELQAPVPWLRLLQEFRDLSHAFTDRPKYLVGRIKQWLRMAHQRFPNARYSAVKTMGTVEEIFAWMAANP